MFKIFTNPTGLSALGHPRDLRHASRWVWIQRSVLAVAAGALPEAAQSAAWRFETLLRAGAPSGVARKGAGPSMASGVVGYFSVSSEKPRLMCHKVTLKN